MRKALLGIGLLLMAATACSSIDEASVSGAEPNLSAPAGTEETVTVRDQAFTPDEITIAEDTTVTWVNEDEMGHTVTNGEGGAPDPDALFDEPLNAGQTVTYTFDEPGTYEVTCRVHHDMQMTVIVEESGS